MSGACTALFYTVRLKSTYFLNSRLFIAIANFAFIIVLLQSTVADVLGTFTSEPLYLSMVSVMLISVGFASYLLQSHNSSEGIREVSDFLMRAPKQFIIFVATVVAWSATVLIDQPYAVATTTDGTVHFIQPQPIFNIANLLVLISFLALPVYTFYKQSSNTKDTKAAGSIRTISFAWASFGFVAFLQSLVPTVDFPASRSLLQVANGALFLMIAYALREPTVLGRMIGASSSRGEGYYSSSRGITIVLYNMDSDRRRFVEDFLRADSPPGTDVFCYVAKNDVPYYHAIISENPAQYGPTKRPKFTIRPIESSSLGAMSPMELSRSRRELIDTGDLELSSCRRFAEDRRKLDQTGHAPNARVWAVSSDTERVFLDEVSRASPGVRVVDLAANQNLFSQRLGIIHGSLLGSRILLEFDPVYNVETLIREFVDEFVSNAQPVAVFTSLGSPVFRELQQVRNARLFVFSSKISTPLRATDGQVLLPDRDSSLLLDAVDKLVQTSRGDSVALVFEVFTDIALSQGFEKAYGILSSILELAESGSSTGLVLLNTSCIDDTALQGIRGLFKFNYKYGADGLTNVRASSSQTLKRESVSPLDDQGSQIRSAVSP